VHIGLDEGVCGAAASTLQTQRVADVHAFPGHITCDADSRSELVIPLIVNGELIGVLDIDSPEPARFSETDQAGVERLCRTFCALQEQRKNFI
jgi:GAF domain-containing protein